MIKDEFKVGKGQWKRWTPQAQRVFNYLYPLMLENKSLFVHPKADYVQDVLWKTTAWNAAWMAAEAVVLS